MIKRCSFLCPPPWSCHCIRKSATLRRLPAAAAAALSPGSQAKEFRLRPRVRAHEAHTTRLPGDRALTVPRSEPSVPCASYSRLAFRKALSRLFSEVGGAAAPGAHLGAEEGRGVAGRRHRCAEQKQHGRGEQGPAAARRPGEPRRRSTPAGDSSSSDWDLHPAPRFQPG